MYGFGVALHVLGIAIWLGASLTFMVFGPASRRMPLEAWAATWQTLAVVQRMLVAPSAAVATVTGLLLTMSRVQGHLGMTTSLMLMQAFGLIAAILTIVFATPLVNRMAAIAQRSVGKGQMDPAAERIRKVLAMVGSVAGVFVVVAIYFGVANPA